MVQSDFDHNIFYRNAVTQITSSLDIGQTLQRFLHFVEEVMPVDIVQIHIWEPDLGGLRILASVTRHQINEPDELVPIPAPFRSIPEWNQREIVKIVSDISEDPISELIQTKVNQLYQAEANYAHMIMRLQLEGERIGDIAVLTKKTAGFQRNHAEMLELLHQPFAIAASNALRHRDLEFARNQLATRNSYLNEELNRLSSRKVIGENLGLYDIMQRVEQVAVTEAPVLLLGETGVGKDIIAQTIYDRSQRNDQAFVRVNCGAIPESLLNSELFGHEKGAFTDAQKRHEGYFERANGGTIFLDEIGELSPAAQIMLLRVVQNKEFERVGGKQVIHADVRIIAATNRDLQQHIDDGLFRSDLYYRLSVFPIKVPPLRERISDIPLLVDHLLKTISQRMNIFPPRLDSGAMERLSAYNWPGNIRELMNVIEHEIIRNPKGPLSFSNLTDSTSVETEKSVFNFYPQNTGVPLPFDEMNRYYLRQVLNYCQGKVYGKNSAAELLQINPHTLRSRLKKLGLI